MSYLSKVANFNLPHLHLAPPLGVTHSNFVDIFSSRKLESVGYRVALFVFSCFNTILARDDHIHT